MNAFFDLLSSRAAALLGPRKKPHKAKPRPSSSISAQVEALDRRLLFAGISLTPNGPNEIDVGFTADGGETAEHIYRSTDGVTYTLIDTNPGTNPYPNIGLSADTVYYYEFGDGNSGSSDNLGTAYASQETAPNAPTISGSQTEPGQVTLTMSHDSFVTGGTVYRSTSSGGGGTEVGTYGSGNTSYVDNGGGPPGLPADTTYYYTAVDYNSGLATSSTISGPVITGPAAPFVSKSSAGSSQIVLSISNDSTATTMQVYINNSQVYSGGVASSYTATGLSSDTSYTFIVTDTNAYGVSIYSAGTATTTATTAPYAPSLSASANGSSEIDLTISADSSASSLVVYESSTGSSGTYSQIYFGSSTSSYAVTGLSSSSTYYFYVTSSNANGISDPSNTANATTT